MLEQYGFPEILTDLLARLYVACTNTTLRPTCEIVRKSVLDPSPPELLSRFRLHLILQVVDTLDVCFIILFNLDPCLLNIMHVLHKAPI